MSDLTAAQATRLSQAIALLNAVGITTTPTNTPTTGFIVSVPNGSKFVSDHYLYAYATKNLA